MKLIPKFKCSFCFSFSFAMRAKTVKNKPQVNEIVTEAAMMKRMESEVKRLNTLLEQERKKNENHVIENVWV